MQFWFSVVAAAKTCSEIKGEYDSSSCCGASPDKVAEIGFRPDLWIQLHALSAGWVEQGLEFHLYVPIPSISLSNAGPFVIGPFPPPTGIFRNGQQVAGALFGMDPMSVTAVGGTFYTLATPYIHLNVSNVNALVHWAAVTTFTSNDPVGGLFQEVIAIPQFHTPADTSGFDATTQALFAELETLNTGTLMRMYSTPGVQVIDGVVNAMVLFKFMTVPSGFDLRAYSTELSIGGTGYVFNITNPA